MGIGYLDMSGYTIGMNSQRMIQLRYEIMEMGM